MHYDENHDPLSQIVISQQVEEALEQLKIELQSHLVVSFYHDDFLIEHSKEVTKAAYIAESQTKYIIIAGLGFNSVVQNSLLKLLEEPPRNIRFILLIPAKSILLPTVLSRLPIFRRKESVEEVAEVGFSFINFDLAQLNQFVKKHERIGKRDAKNLVEAMLIQATKELGVLSFKQLEAFDRAYLLLELNSRPNTVFINILLLFLARSAS
ncbi:MAG: DNA polymerase III subunit delta' [Thiovulaceae bacterium]|nr:DNA polymerase III subunit delta' [Sulfurimonadaceae bacterium]